MKHNAEIERDRQPPEVCMPRKALVVDSDYFFVEFLSTVLEKRGYQVFKAYDGKQGIAGLEEGPFDIMFADLVIPKVSGRQLFRSARRKFNGHCCPLVALAGTVIEQMESLDAIGADYFIAKGPMDKLAVQLNQFITEMENRPALPPAEKKILQTGGVFPRRDAIELLGSVEFQQAVVDCLGVGVVVIDTDTRIMNANSAALGTLEKSLSEILNCPILNHFSAEPVIGAARGAQAHEPGARRHPQRLHGQLERPHAAGGGFPAAAQALAGRLGGGARGGHGVRRRGRVQGVQGQ